MLCKVPNVGCVAFCKITLLEPLDAAAISIVPVMAPTAAMVNVAAAAPTSPTIILEPDPETVQAASVVALFSIL